MPEIATLVLNLNVVAFTEELLLVVPILLRFENLKDSVDPALGLRA